MPLSPARTSGRAVISTGTSDLYPQETCPDNLDREFVTIRGSNGLIAGLPDLNTKETPMKKLTLTFWLALAVASIFAIQATPSFKSIQTDMPLPTCPPHCSAK
jgi:hypothetical protein